MKATQSEQNETQTQAAENWQPKVLILGAAVGALVGAGAAYLFAQNLEKRGQRPAITPGQGVKLGLLLLGLVRSIAGLSED